MQSLLNRSRSLRTRRGLSGLRLFSFLQRARLVLSGRSVVSCVMATADPCLFVIFGGTGDLARRKLLPSLARLLHNGHAHPKTRIVGVGRSVEDKEKYHATIRDHLTEYRVDEPTSKAVLERLHYAYIGDADSEDSEMARLKDELDAIATEHDIGDNRVFYLALPPRIFAQTAERLSRAGMNTTRSHGEGASSDSWQRIVVEKPFGRDLKTARELNTTLHEHFDETQIYRIDHYLGKDTVQNVLTYRLANALIEGSWNRDRIESVQITVAESLGVGSRAGYYNTAGALRDMVQNHLMQLLTLVAMEPPTAFAASPIRREKIKVLESIEPLTEENVIRARYTAGFVENRAAIGYLDEENIPDDSATETFVAIRLFIDNWRWKGVPFYLRTGKRMPRKTSQIVIRYRDAPVRFFESVGVERDTSDLLVITLQPSEGFTFHLDIKMPGEPFELRRVPMRFAYADTGKPLPDAYDTLLQDVMEGDQTLFVHAEETELSWKIFQDFLDRPEQPLDYPAGTWGPPEAKDFAIPDEEIWQTRPTHLPPGGQKK